MSRRKNLTCVVDTGVEEHDGHFQFRYGKGLDWLGLGSGLERLRHGMTGYRDWRCRKRGAEGCSGARHQRIALCCVVSPLSQALGLQHRIINSHAEPWPAELRPQNPAIPMWRGRRRGCKCDLFDATDRKVPVENLLRRVDLSRVGGVGTTGFHCADVCVSQI